MHPNHQVGLFKHWVPWGLRISHSVCMRSVSRIHIFNKLPGDVNAAGPGTTLKTRVSRIPRPDLSCVCVWRGGCFPTSTSNSQVPAECLRIQLSSDALYPEIESDCRGKGLSPTRLQSPSDASHKSMLLPVLLTDRQIR